jgi:hypothetical protein
MKTLKQHVDKRLSALKSERSHYIDEWRDMSDFIYGSRGRWLLSKGQKVDDRRNDRLYNEEAKMAANTLASGMMAGITSPARPWFNLTTTDPDLTEYGPVKRWLADVEKLLQEIFNRSNFYNSVHSIYKELGAYGTAAMGVYEDFDTIIRCEPYTIGSYCLATDGRRQVDTFYREYRMTVDQLVDQFGIENVSPSSQNMYRQGQLDAWVDVIHAVEPNRSRNYNSPLAADMKFMSVYFESSAAGGGQKPLRVSGFRENPIMAPRWEVVGEDVYSSSYPGIDCINTNKSLQIEELDKAIAIEKMHNPPLVGDAAIDGEGLDLIAGGVTFVPNMASLGKPGLQSVYDVNLNIGHLKEDIMLKEQRIQRAFYADLFMMVTSMDRAQITATEIAARQEEKLLMLGPVLERLNNELLDPVIDRTFAIAQRKGIVPPAPPELEGQEMRVQYVSVLAQAQKAVATSSIEATAGFTMNLAQVDPNVIDKLDTDQMIDEYAKAKGVPPSTIRSDDDVAALREQRQAAAQQQQQMEQMSNMVESAKTLSETDTSGDNALTNLTGALAG